MRKTALCLGLMLIAAVFLVSRNTPEPVPFEPEIRWQEPAPVCPWRDPDGDMKVWFPNAGGYKEETCVLSHQRPELEKAFQHPPEPSDMSPTIFRILSRDGLPLGVVMTRRVKGEHGAIEIVAPFNLQGTLFGIKVQRHREPDKIGKHFLESQTQQRLIENKTESGWEDDFKASAEAIQIAINHLRVLYSACGKKAGSAQSAPLK